MIIRKNIALEKKHLKKIECLLDKNDNNLSAAIRDSIDFTSTALEHFETLEEAAKYLTQKQRELSPLEESIRSGRNVIINYPMMLWFLKHTRGIFVDKEIIDEILDPLTINTISQLDTAMNEICQNLGWMTKISLFSMDNLNPESVTLMVSEGGEIVREFIALLVAQFFAYNFHLDVETLHRRASSMRIDFKRINPDSEFTGLEHFLGYNDSIIKEIHAKTDYWKTMITINLATNYNMVCINTANFEKALAGKVIQDTSIIESFIKKRITDIQYPEFIAALKLLHEKMGIVEKIEYPDMNSIRIYHKYHDEAAIRQIADSYKAILESNGQHFNAKYSASLIILERIRS